MSNPANTDSREYLARRYSRGTFVYNIDIAGTCNLGCASCPVGNTPLGSVSRGERPRGFMPFELFAQIVEKIARETPVERPVITLRTRTAGGFNASCTIFGKIGNPPTE